MEKQDASMPLLGRGKKIIVAMSGGVDSSVSAALLKKAGFDVTGMYMKCWSADDPFGENCCASDDERMARLAAAKIGISFYSVNLTKEYKERVVQYLLDGYKSGITPNPDVMCNKEIKFGLFFDKAMDLGADFIATGHYARLRRETRNPKSLREPEGPLEPRTAEIRNKNGNNIQILQGTDTNKDQSYFLSFIRPEILERVMFPIGGYSKPEVRKLAKKFNLPNAERKDSQGICFVGRVDFVKFLKQYIKPSLGNIVDMQGNILGNHEGAFYYTIGQRKGLGLGGGPYFIVDKDVKKNTLTVSKNEDDLLKKEVYIKDLNWFIPFVNGILELKQNSVTARLRYRQTPALGYFMVDKNGQTGKLVFKEAQRAVTAGQMAVLYIDQQMLAGGVIV